MSVERFAGIAAFAVVAAGVAIGFATIGPPQHMRAVELDRRRVGDLQYIERLLRGTGETDRRRPGFHVPVRASDSWPHDPLTGRPYEYQRVTPSTYRLCATFALASDPDDADTHWRHRAGRTCYRLDANSDWVAPERIMRTFPI